MHQIIIVLSGFSRPTKTVKNFSVTKFFISDINISYHCKIILLKRPLIYLLNYNRHIVDMYTVYDILGMYFKVVILT